MRIVFFGTPQFAVASLERLLHERYDIAAVVTQPDKPHGRSRSTLVDPPVKLAAAKAGLQVLQPERPTGDVFLASLRRLAPDLGVVVAYGHILRRDLLTLPPRGMINVHASLLPRFRGAAPIQHAILEGGGVTGVSIMKMEEGLDSGPVLLQVDTPIGERETAGELSGRLAELGATALLAALARLEDGTASAEPQDAAAATYAPKVDRDSARLDWTRQPAALARQVRAFDPAPGAWTTHHGAPLKLFGPTAREDQGEPGTVLSAGDDLVVAAGGGALALREVQPAGKTRLPVADWVRGRGIAPGERLA
jgi:methionyl-tRNA formyltransferase